MTVRAKKTFIIIILFSFSAMLLAQKSKAGNLKTGEIFLCDFEPQVDNLIPNYLKVKSSKRTAVAVKLIDKSTDKCIRYAFINQKGEYDITGIPQGIYYVKVAYGKEWQFQDSSKCVGEFKVDAGYKKLSRILNYMNKGTKKSPKIPSYELDLDVKHGSADNDELISVEEFQK